MSGGVETLPVAHTFVSAVHLSLAQLYSGQLTVAPTIILYDYVYVVRCLAVALNVSYPCTVPATRKLFLRVCNWFRRRW